MSYVVVRCKSCGMWSNRQINDVKTYSFKCFYCNKTTKIRQENTLGLALMVKGPFGRVEAFENCKALNMKNKDVKR